MVELPAVTRQRVAELRATHKPAGIKLTRAGRFSWRNLFRDRRCHMCGQTTPCSQINWCDDVEAGLISPAGWRP